mgnify:CR=1 FL=1
MLFLVGTVAMLAWLDAAAVPRHRGGDRAVGIWALVHYRTRLESKIGTLRQRSADIGSFLIETLQAVKLVVASNAQEREVARFAARNDAFVDALMSMQLLTYLSGGLPGLILSAGTGAVFVYGGLRVINGSIIGRHVRRVHGVSDAVSAAGAGADGHVREPRDGARSRSAAWRRLLDEPVEIRSRRRRSPLPAVRGDIEFDDVTLSFRSRRCRCSSTCRSTSAPAKCSPSSGRAAAASRRLPICCCGCSIPMSASSASTAAISAPCASTDLRRRVALVDQEPAMLHATIAENIRYARPDASDAEVRDAARQAALIDSSSGCRSSCDTVVGERGMALSAGERQRIATARAFLTQTRRSSILDEPTAALDPTTERPGGGRGTSASCAAAPSSSSPTAPS